MNNTQVLDYIKKSFELKNQGFYKPAIEMLYKALAIDGENLEILVQLAHLYKLLGNFQRAVNYIDKVLEIDNKNLDCLNLLEEIYLLQENLESAKNISEKIYEIQPVSQNLAKKIRILNKLKDFESIKQTEESLFELNNEVLYEIAHAYYNNNFNDKAIELLESEYAKNNTNQDIMFLLAEIYYEEQKFERSKKIFAELSRKCPTAQVQNYLGLFCLNERNYPLAVKYFSDAVKIDENNAQYSYNLASAYFLNGWLDEALKYFNQAICLEPSNINYHYSLAYLYYQKKMYDKALFELNFIMKIEPNHSLSNVLNAMITAKNGDLLSAENQLKNIIKNNTEDDFAYYALSLVYKELTRMDPAKEMISRAIDLNPNSLEYLSELVEIKIEQKQYEDAFNYIDNILKINDKYIFAYIALAKINLELKKFDKLFDAAQEIIELDSNSPEGYYYNAAALFNQGDKDFAIESLKKAVSLDLNNASLYAKMSEFYQESGDFKNAYEWAKEASEIDDRNYKYKWLCAKLAAVLNNRDEAIKNYSKSYRLASFDENLRLDYANYLKSLGKNKQAEKILMQ